MSQKLVPFDFHGDTLEVAKEGATLRVSIRSICKGLGVDNAGQQERLATKPWAVVEMISITAADGKVYETACIDMDTLVMMLATIDARRVKAEARPKLERYQKECKKVLADAFLRPAQVPAQAGGISTAVDLAPLQAQLADLRTQQLAHEAKLDSNLNNLVEALNSWLPYLKDLGPRIDRTCGGLRTLQATVPATARTQREALHVPLGIREDGYELDGAELTQFGIRVFLSRTTPNDPTKKPRDVWNVYATTRYKEVLAAAGGTWNTYAKCWQFWRDPREVILDVLERIGATP